MADAAYDLIIANGTVVTDEGVQEVDVAVAGERIAVIAPRMVANARRRIDAHGKLVFPGFIDPHTHMGIPIKDTRSADDFRSGSLAAAHGGVTTILDFTVQEPGQSLRAAAETRVKKATGKSHVDFGIHVNVTDAPLQHLDEIPSLVSDGFTSFKTFSTYREAGMMISWDEFRGVLARVNRHGGIVQLHAEDNELVERWTAEQVGSGARAPICHSRSRPVEAEAKAIRDAARIAGEVGAPLYIVHLSSKAGLEAGLEARARGVDIYLETCPQYLVLTEEKYREENGHFYITTPALRAEEDVAALWQAVAAGEIDTIGTDHCPFTIAQKNSHDGFFYLTPNGLPGVETLFPLLYTHGVAAGRITLEQMVALLSGNAARIFGIAARKGGIRVGADADFVIWDPEQLSRIITPALHGNADWSPYEGMRVAGTLLYTILRGHVLVGEGRFEGNEVFGQFLPAQPRALGTAHSPYRGNRQ